MTLAHRSELAVVVAADHPNIDAHPQTSTSTLPFVSLRIHVVELQILGGSTSHDIAKWLQCTGFDAQCSPVPATVGASPFPLVHGAIRWLS